MFAKKNPFDQLVKIAAAGETNNDNPAGSDISTRRQKKSDEFIAFLADTNNDLVNLLQRAFEPLTNVSGYTIHPNLLILVLERLNDSALLALIKKILPTTFNVSSFTLENQGVSAEKPPLDKTFTSVANFYAQIFASRVSSKQSGPLDFLALALRKLPTEQFEALLNVAEGILDEYINLLDSQTTNEVISSLVMRPEELPSTVKLITSLTTRFSYEELFFPYYRVVYQGKNPILFRCDPTEDNNDQATLLTFSALNLTAESFRLIKRALGDDQILPIYTISTPKNNAIIFERRAIVKACLFDEQKKSFLQKIFGFIISQAVC